VIKGDFVPKGTEQFNHSSQDLNLEYNKHLVLLLWQQPELVKLVKKKGVLGLGFVEESMDLLAQIYLVGMEAHCRLDSLEQSSYQPKPQALPPHKPYVP
jgi:hypothetical protein